MREDFPEPVRPMMATFSPGGMVRVMLLRMGVVLDGGMVLELGDVRGCGRGKGLTHSSKQRSRT